MDTIYRIEVPHMPVYKSTPEVSIINMNGGGGGGEGEIGSVQCIKNGSTRGRQGRKYRRVPENICFVLQLLHFQHIPRILSHPIYFRLLKRLPYPFFFCLCL